LTLSADLPRTNRLLIEGDYYESLGDHEKAASAYHALFELFPDNVDYGLQLALAQIAAGRSSQARETLSQLRKLSAPFSDDPRIDLAEAKTVARSDEALPVIRAAVAKASAQGKRLLYAQARRDECKNLVYSEHLDQGPVICQDAYRIFMAAGNRLGAADSIRLLGDVLGSQGRFDEAVATYQRALSILEGTGEHEKTGAILNNMAINFENQGNLQQAEQLYQKAKSHFEQAGDKHNVATALSNIADILYERGNLQGARRLYEQGLSTLGALDGPSDPGYLLYRLADLELAEGQVGPALTHAQKAVDAYVAEHYQVGYLTEAMIMVGNVFEAENNLEGARQQFEQSLNLQKQAGQAGLVAETQEELSRLALEQGQPEQAEPLLREAISQFEKEKASPDASSAYTLLSRALLMQGKVDESRKAAQQAVELSLVNNDPALKLAAAIQLARVEVALAGRRGNSVAVARQKLLSAISVAHRLGYYQLECEARIALGELEMRTNPAEARNQLFSLSNHAHERGLELLARQAEQAIAPSGNTAALSKSGH
jgi:tetratricopeptide (TPR) repeat protein